MENLEIDPNKEYILAGDISMSMTQNDPRCNGLRRYDYMLEKFQAFIQEASDFDQHGAPTVMLFGEEVQVFEQANLDIIRKRLSSVRFEGFTNLHLLIEKAFELHKIRTQLLVFTDGDPSSRILVDKELFKIVNSINSADEFQIHFLTVGTISPSLKNWLEGLHDKMEDKIKNPRDFDIIHISAIENTNFLKVVGANRHD